MPRRRCVGCGRIAPKSELVRLVLAEPPAAATTGTSSVVAEAGTPTAATDAPAAATASTPTADTNVRAAHARSGRGAGSTQAARRAVIDPACTLPGRGAYLCRGDAPDRADAQCVALATRRGAIARALRRAVQVDLDGSTRPAEFVESSEPGNSP